MTVGWNHNHLLLSARDSRLSFLPSASTMKNAVGASLSPLTIGESVPGSTHSVRHSSPITRYSLGALFFVVQRLEAIFSSVGEPITGTSSSGSMSVLAA